MNGVIGMLELLGRTELKSEQRELLQAVEDSAGVLLQILNDVLDFSKIEAGDLRLDEAPFDPRALLDNVVGMMSAHMHRKGLHVTVAADAALAGELVGDSTRIRQILLNLLGNAGKFTEQGCVSVSLRVLGDDGERQRLQLAVRDTGIGIAEDKQAHLFTPFSQAESWTTRRYGGTGLGLAICRHLAQLMGGSISLTSRLGEGTTVAVELRLPISRRPICGVPPGLAGRHAIVRLDAPDTAAALTAYLDALGITTEQVPPGQPLREGMSASLLFVEEDDRDSAQAVAAAVVAASVQPGLSIGQDAGQERLLLGVNPLKWQALVRACAQALTLEQDDGAAAAATGGAPLPAAVARMGRRRILVAEDHPVSQQLVRRQFELLGWPCDVVADGLEALAALRDGDYAILITDCSMPRMDGYELATAWRRHEDEDGRRSRLPIIAMTAHAVGSEIARCREAGMDDYLSKPVQLRQLEEKIELWMPRGPQPPAADEPADDGGALGAALGEDEAKAIGQDMLRMLVDTSEADLDQLGRAIGAGDAAQAGQLLHRVLGAVQLFSDDPLLAEGRGLLEGLHAGGGDSLLPRLPGYLARLRGLLARLARRLDGGEPAAPLFQGPGAGGRD
jgi:CheY-like chemotaxis protein